MATLTTVFNGAQTFYIHPDKVKNAKQVMISAVDLYFKHKPDINSNFSGVKYPGVSLFIAETMFGVPRITRQSGIFSLENLASVGYFSIQTSSDASVPTTFRFDLPVLVDTGKEYAFIWRFDYLDQFELWTSKAGDVLVGVNEGQISPGPSGQNVGAYFDFFNVFIADEDTDLDQYMKNWRPVADTDVKFDVHISRFSHEGVPVTSNASIDAGLIHENAYANVEYSNNNTAFDMRFGSYEYISFREELSERYQFVGGQYIWQNTVPFPGGYANGRQAVTVATSTTYAPRWVTAQSTYPNGSPFSWSDIFGGVASTGIQNRVVFRSGNTFNVRRVHRIASNTVMQLDEPLTFTNSAAHFMVTPVGKISSFEKHSPFGFHEAFVMIANSSANSTVRFVNNCIESIAVAGGGTGYNNSDILFVQGFENVANKVIGGYKAIANVVTNSTGGITTVYLSNIGCGFVNTDAMSIVLANSSSGNTTSNTSAGSGATFTYSIGASLETELTRNVFKGCIVRNLDVGEFIPYLELKNPPGISYNFQIEMPYYRETDANTYSGYAYYVSANADSNRITINMYTRNFTENMNYIPVLPSKSNEHVIKYPDGSSNDKITTSESFYSLAFRFIGNVASNSDYTCAMFKGLPSVWFSKYIVNFDYDYETTDRGDAWAKHITKVVKLQRPAEDIRIYVSGYMPFGTDLIAYARIHKDEDPEPFDDKFWTLLEKKNTVSLSSLADTQDYVEIEYGFKQYPSNNHRTATTGTITTTLDSTSIAGANTLFQSELANNDTVLIRSLLFPENHVMAVVNTITSNTALTLTEPISNSSLVSEGLVIEKSIYPGQAFNNIQRDNVVTYYNTGYAKFEGYDQVAVKILFMSNNAHVVPRMDDLRIVAVSA